MTKLEHIISAMIQDGYTLDKVKEAWSGVLQKSIKGEETERAVILTQGEYETLRYDQEFLTCLEACGVDNWDGYGEAHEMLNAEDDGYEEEEDDDE